MSEEYSQKEYTNDYDRCETAFEIPEPGLGDFFAFNGNTIATRPNNKAVMKFDDITDTCSIRDSSRGQYVTFMGTGETVTITLAKLLFDAEIIGNASDGRFEIAVLTGESCEQCLLYRDFIFAGEEGESESEIHNLEIQTTDKDTRYTVLVAGESYSDVGTFNLLIMSSSMSLSATSLFVATSATAIAMISMFL